MKEQLNITANIPNDIIKLLYKPLKATYPGSWEDFNALIIYMGMIMCLGMWEEGMDILTEQGELPSDPKVRSDLRKMLLVKFLHELSEKGEVLVDSSQLKRFVDIIDENFRPNL